MTEEDRVREAARLVAAIDPDVAVRLRVRHPPTGWCVTCRTSSPCSTRQFVDLVAREAAGPS